MKGNSRLEQFLRLQSKNIEIENIASELGITVKTLRTFLNKNGYKLRNGKYINEKEKGFENNNQVSFEEIKNKHEKEKITKKNNNQQVKKRKSLNEKIENKPKSAKIKKDKKINITQEDLDKLCEVYDWYLQVKDNKVMKPKKTSSKKDIVIEDRQIKELKTTSIRVEKKTWEEFERLCSNSDFNKQEIITQALKDFMKQYKYLL